MSEELIKRLRGYSDDFERRLDDGIRLAMREAADALSRPAPAPVAVPDGGPLRKLGARLAELLDEDQFAECEALLLAAAPSVPATVASEAASTAGPLEDVQGALDDTEVRAVVHMAKQALLRDDTPSRREMAGELNRVIGTIAALRAQLAERDEQLADLRALYQEASNDGR